MIRTIAKAWRCFRANENSDDLARQARNRGSCVAVAWGHPWEWLPSFERSRESLGWSFTWLWFGLYHFRVSIGTLMLDGVFPRCGGCNQPARARDLRYVTSHDGTHVRLCEACREEPREDARWLH